jgi:signal transduction histidine kinase
MLENVQLWIYGTAALIDTVLLFALVERHNWRAVTVWMLLLALGVWMWHGGTFVRQLVEPSIGALADPVRWLAMISMAAGLLLMPSAALHGTCRLLTHGQFQIAPRANPRLLLCYLPLLLLLPMSHALALQPSSPFLTLLAAYQIPYVVWLNLVSVATAYGLIRTVADTKEAPWRWFNHSLAASMVLIGLLAAAFVITHSRPSTATTVLQTVVGVSPIIPVLLFAYFVMRFQLLPLILERTLAYGAVLMGAMLFHAIVLRGAVSDIATRYRVDLGIVEGILALGVILLYQPLRDRVAAALQSLVDSSRHGRRERRRLAVQLAARSGDPVPELLSWFTMTMQETFGTDLAAAWLCSPSGSVVEKTGAAHLLDDGQVQQLLTAMTKSNEQFITRYSSSDAEVLAILDQVRAGAVLGFQHSEVRGLFLVGCSHWGQPPSEEDLHALLLLVEQFGVTLHNSQLQALQVAAEHRVLQQEKLSVLGLLAGSLAHEIKNPLSSIKTITHVLAEELGPDSPHAEDLQMIAGEIDRLSASTSELLDVARPHRADQPLIPLKQLLSPTLRLLQHLAREYKATLNICFPEEPIIGPWDQSSLREIVFNLISNGLEAAGEGGTVKLACRCEAKTLAIDIQDTGRGVSAEQRARIFEPFFTTKQTGTGLGLYIVARRVRELGGRITLRNEPNQGTTFEVRLPVKEPRPSPLSQCGECGTP